MFNPLKKLKVKSRYLYRSFWRLNSGFSRVYTDERGPRTKKVAENLFGCSQAHDIALTLTKGQKLSPSQQVLLKNPHVQRYLKKHLA